MGQKAERKRVKYQTRTLRPESPAGRIGVSGGHGDKTMKTLECHMTSGEYVTEAE